jgi:hypothetical protein
MWSGLADIDGLSGKELAPPHESVGQSLLHCRKVGQPEGIEQIGHPWRQGVQGPAENCERDSTACGRAEHRSDRAAPAQRAGAGRVQESAVLQPLDAGMLPSSGRALRMEQAQSTAALHAGWPMADRLGDGDRDLSHELCAGFCNGALAARRHGRGDERIQRHGGRAPGPP